MGKYPRGCPHFSCLESLARILGKLGGPTTSEVFGGVPRESSPEVSESRRFAALENLRGTLRTCWNSPGIAPGIALRSHVFLGRPPSNRL